MAGARYVLLPRVDGFEDRTATQEYASIGRRSLTRRVFVSATVAIVDTTTGKLLPVSPGVRLSRTETQELVAAGTIPPGQQVLIGLAGEAAARLCREAADELRPAKVVDVTGRQAMINRGTEAGFIQGALVEFYAVKEVADPDSGQTLRREVPVGQARIVRSGHGQSYAATMGEDLGVAGGCLAKVIEDTPKVGQVKPAGAAPESDLTPGIEPKTPQVGDRQWRQAVRGYGSRWRGAAALLGVALGLFLCGGLGGCATGQLGMEGSAAATWGPEGEMQQSKYVVINNEKLAAAVQVVDLKTSWVGDLLRGTVTLVSKNSDTIKIQYKFAWFDLNGVEIAPDGPPVEAAGRLRQRVQDSAGGGPEPQRQRVQDQDPRVSMPRVLMQEGFEDDMTRSRLVLGACALTLSPYWPGAVPPLAWSTATPRPSRPSPPTSARPTCSRSPAPWSTRCSPSRPWWR